ncbi:MAG: adenylosuccinate lyase [Candidatus Izemoplasmatales bacterium]
MIERYSREKMVSVWSDESKFKAFLEIELLNMEALNKLGLVTSEEVLLARKNAKFDISEIESLEQIHKHDVIAFTRNVSSYLGNEKRWIHYGLTSTDVVDTALGIRFKQANDIIEEDLLEFQNVLKEKAYLYQNTYCIGRTHGIHADITVFGLKWALWYDEFNRHLSRFRNVRKEVEVGKISGAVGNYAFVDPFVETYICQKAGLQQAHISTQTLQRDRIASYLSVISLIATSLEKIALEIRHLQRTEVGEVMESFSSSQKGSSAMPHKKNPISSENITGLARVIRGYMIPAFEDIPLWHERDISHSSVERIILPDATTLIDYMLNRYQGVLSTLIVNEDQMLQNIQKTHGVIFSQRILTKLIEKGASREEAYDLVQGLTKQAYLSSTPFQQLLLENSAIQSKLTTDEIKDCFTLEFYKLHVHEIYQKVFSS